MVRSELLKSLICQVQTVHKNFVPSMLPYKMGTGVNRVTSTGQLIYCTIPILDEGKILEATLSEIKTEPLKLLKFVDN